MPLTASLTELIDKRDGFEVVGDHIAALLAVELRNQRVLARDAGKDTSGWALRIFRERSNPWAEFDAATEDDSCDLSPIVNVSWDTSSFDLSGSNVVEFQKCRCTYHLDVLAAGVASLRDAGGHDPSDASAAVALQGAVRLVRNVLMAGAHTYLSIPQVVSRRFITDIRAFQPPTDERATFRVHGARLTFDVDFLEFSPQVIGHPLEEVAVTVRRASNGQVLLVAEYGEE